MTRRTPMAGLGRGHSPVSCPARVPVTGWKSYASAGVGRTPDVYGACILEGGDGGRAVALGGKAAVGPEPLNTAIKVTRVVVRVVSAPDRLPIPDDIHRRRMGKDGLRAAGPAVVAVRRSFRGVDYGEWKPRLPITVDVLQGSCGEPATAPDLVFQYRRSIDMRIPPAPSRHTLQPRSCRRGRTRRDGDPPTVAFAPVRASATCGGVSRTGSR
jgi:hypothetical protein